jgi:hypothetical protein
LSIIVPVVFGLWLMKRPCAHHGLGKPVEPRAGALKCLKMARDKILEHLVVCGRDLRARGEPCS